MAAKSLLVAVSIIVSFAQIRVEGQTCDPPLEDYVGDLVYEDTTEFWEAVDEKLRDHHCDNFNLTFFIDCKQEFRTDRFYRRIWFYLFRACYFNFPNRAHSLRELVLNYCDNSFEGNVMCTTGCPLADNLQQLCDRILNPMPVCGDNTCGLNMVVQPGESGSFTSPYYPCPYEPQFCSFRLESSVPLRFTITQFDVPCNDELSVYDGGIVGGTQLGAFCSPRDSPVGQTFDITTLTSGVYVGQAFLSPSNNGTAMSGMGFVIDYTTDFQA